MVDSRGPQIVGIAAFFIAFSWVFILLRCYCRIALVKSFGLDDILCLVAQILFTAYCALNLAAVANGLGQHLADIPPSHIQLALKWLWISDPCYAFSNMMLKLSIGVFFLRICVSNIQRTIIWIVMVVSAIVIICFSFIAIFQCQPVSFFWERLSSHNGSCISPEITIAATYLYTIVSCISDWTYCTLPALMVWNLQMNRSTKISVCLILGVSSLYLHLPLLFSASVITLVRIPSISGISSSDALYDNSDVIIWSMCETGLALAACASTTLRPLARLISDRFSSHSGTVTHSTHIAYHGTWPTHTGYVRNGSRAGKDEMGIQTVVGVSSRDREAIHLSKWPEDGHSDGMEGDVVSNSSQTGLKTDLGADLASANSLSIIKKTVVSLHSAKI